MQEIPVTRTFLPPMEEYISRLGLIWGCGQLTNNGPMLIELEQRLASYLQLPADRVILVSSGTSALQLALASVNGIQGGEVVTTPFSYVATASAIQWMGGRPIFADIDPETLCLDAESVEARITPETRAILGTHVYGRPCPHESLMAIGAKWGLPVLYDGAHAFGVRRKRSSILGWGMATAVSFHATKLFHSGEGGAVVAGSDRIARKLRLLRSFGHQGDRHVLCGTNAKLSEFHAALGLTVLPYLEKIMDHRRMLCSIYDERLQDIEGVRPLGWDSTASRNYAYYPVLFEEEEGLHRALASWRAQQIYPRRYFFPSLNRISYFDGGDCPVAEQISRRILCLPLSSEYSADVVHRTMDVLQQSWVLC